MARLLNATKIHLVDVPALPRLRGLRYVVPLREGGSLPAVVDVEGEGEGEGAFVVKFRGAGQGPKALIAEALVGLVGLALGLPIPRPAIVELDEGFGRSEPDPEIQDLLRGSVGANFGLEYLPGALAFDPSVDTAVLTPELAADIVWLDAYLTNVDRTPRNTNLLVCDQSLWLIDHGAALFMHHRWADWRQRIHSPFPQIADHVLLPFAGDLAAADARLRSRLDTGLLTQIVERVPEDWLVPEAEFANAREQRDAYVTYLVERLSGPRPWLFEEAVSAQQRGPNRLGPRLTHRVV